MFQETEVASVRANVNGYIIGPSFNDNTFRFATKE